MEWRGLNNEAFQYFLHHISFIVYNLGQVRSNLPLPSNEAVAIFQKTSLKTTPP